MNLEIKDEFKLFLEGKEILMAKEKIYKVEQFDANKIIIRLRASENNLFCIDKKGKVLWVAESSSPTVNLPYQNFTIKDGYIRASAVMAIDSVDVKIDPATGKIIEKHYFK